MWNERCFVDPLAVGYHSVVIAINDARVELSLEREKDERFNSARPLVIALVLWAIVPALFEWHLHARLRLRGGWREMILFLLFLCTWLIGMGGSLLGMIWSIRVIRKKQRGRWIAMLGLFLNAGIATITVIAAGVFIALVLR